MCHSYKLCDQLTWHWLCVHIGAWFGVCKSSQSVVSDELCSAAGRPVEEPGPGAAHHEQLHSDQCGKIFTSFLWHWTACTNTAEIIWLMSSDLRAQKPRFTNISAWVRLHCIRVWNHIFNIIIIINWLWTRRFVQDSVRNLDPKISILKHLSLNHTFFFFV